MHSDPDGDAYAPVEVDVPFLMAQKSYKWFWAPDTDKMILSLPDLMDIYKKSVGRGAVLLLNATPDTTGLIPESHVKRYKEFGKEIARRFGKPLASGSGQGDLLEIDLKTPKVINSAVIQEDISHGQRVRKFVLEGYSNDKWITIKEGTSVGSKRIEEFPATRLSKVRLRITDAIATPLIQNLALFNIEQSKQNTHDNSKNTSVTLGGWDNRTFTTEWQDFRLDLTPYMVEKVGQFELKFQTITHDRNFEKAISGGYGPELKDWKVDMDGAVNPDAIKKIGDGTFLINNSQHISKESTSKVIFSTQIRTKPGRSVGSIELKMLGFE